MEQKREGWEDIIVVRRRFKLASTVAIRVSLPCDEMSSTSERRSIFCYLETATGNPHEQSSISQGSEGPARGSDDDLYLNVHEVKHSPPNCNFLLRLFPLTMSLRLDSNLPPLLRRRLSCVMEFSGPDGVSVVPMKPFTETDDSLLEGVLLPTTPGIHRFKILLSIGNQVFEIQRGERNIISAQGEELWAQGPLLIKIEEALYLGNAAAAAAPLFLNETIGRKQDEETSSIAVLNASEERNPRPALLNHTRESPAFVYKQFPFKDLPHNPMGKAELWRAVKWIHRQFKDRPVVVHCHAGKGRSASLIIAYLCLFQYPEKSYDQVLAMVMAVVRRAHHEIFPHVGLKETIEEFRERELHQKEIARSLRTS